MNQNKKIFVVAALIKNTKDQYLITKRPYGTHYGGFWEFPGGTVENGETDEMALIRELKEELDITISVYDLFWRGEFQTDSKLIDISFYNCSMESEDTKIKLLGISDFVWANTTDLKTYEFPEADKTLIKLLTEI